jgi:hypothetical protein
MDTGVELHPRTKDGMMPFAKSNTNLPMHVRKKTTILRAANLTFKVFKTQYSLN